MHSLEKWHHNMNINNGFLFVFLKEETYLLYIILIFIKYIYICIYISLDSAKKQVLEISHILKADENITLFTQQILRFKKVVGVRGGGVRRGRQRSTKRIIRKR